MIEAIAAFDPSAPPFSDLAFAAAISLGGNCEPAHWLRAFGRHAVRGPFDWLVTPLDAITSILEEDGARLGTEFALTNEGTSVCCQAYGVLYHHEFPRDAGNAVIFDAFATEACRSKLAHKWTGLLAQCARARADGLPLLFLRLGGSTGLSWDRIGSGGTLLRADDLNAVAAALARRFPNLDFRLLVLLPTPAPGAPAVASDPFGAPDPRVAVRYLPCGVDPDWATDGSMWQDLLAAVRFSAPAKVEALGETLHWSGEADASASVRP